MTTATQSSSARPGISQRKQATAIVTAAFGQNAIQTLVTTFILGYLVNYANFSSAAIGIVGIIITVAKILDAVSDPVMGSVIDMTRTRWGKLRPYILFSALPVAVLTGLMFSVPKTSETTQLVYFGVVYVLWGFVYTVCDVPLWALIGSAFVDPIARTRVVGNVRAFGSISLGLVTLGTMPLVALLSFSAGGVSSGGWSRAVFLIAIVGMGLYLLAFFFGRERVTSAQTRLTFRQLFRTLFRNRPLLLVLIGSILGFGRNMVQTGGTVLVGVFYGRKAATFDFTLVGASLIIGLVLAAFLTPVLIRRITSKRLVITSTLAAAVIYVINYFVGYSNLYVLMVFVFLAGLSSGIYLVLQPTLIADAVDDVENRTGVRNDGISFATLTFSSKVILALATGAFALFVVIAGYQSSVHVTPTIQNTLFVSITLLPALSCLLCVIPLFFYRLGGPTTGPGSRRPGAEGD
jgi:sugar (glycoside-pentoside-hexuronide) transporter